MKGPLVVSTTTWILAAAVWMFLEGGGVDGINVHSLGGLAGVDVDDLSESDGGEEIGTSPELRHFALQAEAAHARLWALFNGSAESLPSGDAPQPQNGSGLQGQPCISGRWMDFTNSQLAKGFYREYGATYQDPEGLRLTSWPNGDGTRMYYDNLVRDSPYLFNGDAQTNTHLMVWFRGAPDTGKNSNFYLIQEKTPNQGVNDPDHGVQDGRRDEIDIVEMYGSSGIAEYNIFRRGGMIGPWNHNALDPGNRDYMYELFLVKGEYLKIWCMTPGPPEQRRILSVKEFTANVPSNPMRLYTGIWDCNRDCPGGCGDKCKTRSPRTSQMCIRGVYISNC